MSAHDRCPDCMGKGWIETRCMIPDAARVCSLCNGTGVTSTEKRCGGCNGTGLIEVRTVEQQKCLKCNGTGRYPPPESL